MGCHCEQMFRTGLDLVPACIGGVWIFESLSSEEQQALAARAMRRTYRQGEVIFSLGAP